MLPAHLAQIFTPLRGRVRPHQGQEHRQRTATYARFFFLLLLLLPVKYFMPKTSKNLVFSGIFVHVEEKTLVFMMCLQKHAIYGVLWIVNAQKTMLFAMFVTSTRSLKCTVNTAVFFTCMTSSSQSKPAKNTGIHKKQDVFNQFCAFSARAPQSKNQSFWLRC